MLAAVGGLNRWPGCRNSPAASGAGPLPSPGEASIGPEGSPGLLGLLGSPVTLLGTGVKHPWLSFP